MRNSKKRKEKHSESLWMAQSTQVGWLRIKFVNLPPTGNCSWLILLSHSNYVWSPNKWLGYITSQGIIHLFTSRGNNLCKHGENIQIYTQIAQDWTLVPIYCSGAIQWHCPYLYSFCYLFVLFKFCYYIFCIFCFLQWASNLNVLPKHGEWSKHYVSSFTKLHCSSISFSAVSNIFWPKAWLPPDLKNKLHVHMRRLNAFERLSNSDSNDVTLSISHIVLMVHLLFVLYRVKSLTCNMIH